MLGEGLDRYTIAATLGLTPGQVSAIAAHVKMGTYAPPSATATNVAGKSVPEGMSVPKETEKTRSVLSELQNLENRSVAKKRVAPVLLGVDAENNNEVFWNPDPDSGSANPHVLVLGESGFGKTYTITCLLAELARQDITSVLRRYYDDQNPSVTLPKVLDESNAFVLGLTTRRLTQIYLELVGEGYWIKERNEFGMPVGLWPLPPHWVTKPATPRTPFFEVKFLGWQGSIPASEIVSFVQPDPCDPYGRGIGFGNGYRCLAGRDTSGVTLWSRRGNLFTKQFRHIAQACERLPANTLVDGEIVALDQSGRISFNLLQHHRSKAQALLFYVFDVLIYRGRSLFKEPLERRRQVLAEVVSTGSEQGRATPFALSESLDASPKDLIRVAKEFGFEGIVAKRKDSNYEPGNRSGAWVKYRVNRGQEFVIGGYVPSDPFESLIVGYYEGHKLIYVAKVRNGFVPQVRRDVARRFKGLEIPVCPFANLPEIEFTEWPPETFKIRRVERGQGRWGGRPGDWELAMTPKHYRGWPSISKEWRHRSL
jgi:bifunctional non-homologous end joining protein LigD